jgi:hypothetical protein
MNGPPAVPGTRRHPIHRGSEYAITYGFAWRKDNTSPLLARFITDVLHFPDVRALTKK